MKKPSHRLTEKQLTLISGGAGLLVFLALCGLIAWAVSATGSLEAQIALLDNTHTELVRKEQNLPRLEREIESLQVEVERSVQILPNEQEIANLIKNLGAIRAQTAENGIAVKIKKFQPEQNRQLPGMAPEEESAEQRFRAHPYIVEAEGNFYHFGRFINLLENHIRFIKVESYEMANPNDKDSWDRPEKNVTIKIVTYTYTPGQGEKTQRGEEPSIEWQDTLDKTFVFERRNRRDPFEVPMKAASDKDDDRRKPLSAREQQELVAQAERLYGELEHSIKTKQMDVALKDLLDIEDIYRQRFTVPEYYQRAQKIYFDAVELTKDIQNQAVRQAVQRAQNLLQEMHRAFAAGDYKRLKAVREQMNNMLSVETDDEELRAKLDRCAAEADALAKRSDVRIEFYKADIRITGFFGGPLRSTVIFNGNRSGEEGMDVEIAGLRFFVKNINVGKGIALIIYKGEEIELVQGEDRGSAWRQPPEEKRNAPAPEPDKESNPEESGDPGDAPPLQG